MSLIRSDPADQRFRLVGLLQNSGGFSTYYLYNNNNNNICDTIDLDYCLTNIVIDDFKSNSLSRRFDYFVFVNFSVVCLLVIVMKMLF